MAEVELENIRKQFGETVAVDDVPVHVRDGELLVLLGPSGCGKSTTLRLIGGLEYPTEGKIELDGRDITDIPPHDRNIAMVFQDLALYSHKSVRANMAFGLKMKGVPKEERNERVEKAAELLQISELLDRSPATLSGGQQQRVAIGRAIVREPEAFLFDEPLSDLDAKLRATLRTEILELHQNLEATMIYVTHAQEEAMTLGDRIAVMNNGKVHQIDDPDTIYAKPTNLFVARFIGNPDMNFFDGHIRSSDDGLHVETDTFEFTLDRVPEGITERDVQVGIRSEDFHNPKFIALDSEKTMTISATVQLIERLGDRVNLHLQKDGVEFIASFDSTNTDVGDTIDAVLDLPELHYFDQDTGNRIEEMDVLREPAKLPSA
jgi:multiple sugar transport system ATP-binding protein